MRTTAASLLLCGAALFSVGCTEQPVVQRMTFPLDQAYLVLEVAHDCPTSCRGKIYLVKDYLAVSEPADFSHTQHEMFVELPHSPTGPVSRYVHGISLHSEADGIVLRAKLDWPGDDGRKVVVSMIEGAR